MKILKVEKCGKCPFIERGSLYSLDGFDCGQDIFCSITKKKLMGFVEHQSEMELIKFPEWCPLENYDNIKE